jgi:hypothetical protein
MAVQKFQRFLESHLDTPSNATTTILTFTPVADTHGQINVYLSAEQTGTPANCYVAEANFAFSVDAGVATVRGSSAIDETIHPGTWMGGGAHVSATQSGGDILVQVTGKNATPITWVAKFSIGSRTRT